MPVTILKPWVARRRKLAARLRSDLLLVSDAKTAQLLREAIEGLDALDHGEVQLMFLPTKTKAHGHAPYTVRKFRAMAVGFVDLLQASGQTVTKARGIVARTFVVTPDYIAEWEADLKKPENAAYAKYRSKISECSNWSQAEILKQLRNCKKEYSVAKSKAKKNSKPITLSKAK